MGMFTKRRGRPAIKRPTYDKGTPELAQKHRLGMTSEPLDILLSRNYITADEHSAGLHARWLYTVKFGIPDLRAANPDGREAYARKSYRDDAWQQRNEAEYGCLVESLRQINAKREVFNICIYKQWPFWLIDVQMLGKKELSPLAKGELTRLKAGLALIKPVGNLRVSASFSEGGTEAP